MHIPVTFKTPGVVEDAVDSLRDYENDDDYDDAVAKANKALSKWIEFGEYVTIDFDTKAGTAKVRELR